MTIKDPQLIKSLKSKASQSSSNFKISAFGLNAKNEIVIKTTNVPRFKKGIHAEELVFRVAAQKNIKTIIICRIGKTGNLLPIDPCPSCAATAKKLGIKIISLC